MTDDIRVSLMFYRINKGEYEGSYCFGVYIGDGNYQVVINSHGFIIESEMSYQDLDELDYREILSALEGACHDR